MLNAHKSKIGHETDQNWDTCQTKEETPEHYPLHCRKYEQEREVLFKTIKKITKKHQYILTT